MASITMCNNKECELRDDCYRFIAIPNTYSQSYLGEPKEDCENKNYECYVDINE